MKKVICGDVVLYQHWCPDCKDFTLTGTKEFICECGYNPQDDKIKKIEIICSTQRGRLGRKEKQIILDNQHGRCYWCNREFGTHIFKKDKHMTLRVNYDHIIPYAYLQGNPKENWCAACNICNSYKHSIMFNTEKQIRNYVLDKWETALRTGYIELT